MDAENSRRSACDRCRGQKLRCVRPPRNTPSADEQTLEPCVRCVKAGAECVGALPTSRKATKDNRLQNPTPSPRVQTGHSPLQPLYPKVTKDSLPQKPSPESDYQGHAEPGDQGNPQPAKRRSVEPGHIAFGSPDFNPHSLTIGSSTTLSFGTNREPAFHHNGPFNVDIASFSLPSTSEPCPKPSEAASMMDMLLEPVSSTESNASTFGFGTNWGDTDVSSDTKTPDSREDGLHRLSELNSRIVRDFKGVNSIAVDDIIFSLSRCEPDNQSGRAEPQSPIGRVLESSQIFLEILQGLKPEHYSYAESECSYSDFRDENELSHLPSDHHQTFRDMEARDSTVYVNNDLAAISPPPSGPPPVDMPMTLIILTCYTMLLQTYETIFSRIHECLFSQHEQVPRQLIPPVLPGLHIGGFYLNKHQDLQMDILISLSYKMLERIEEALGINVVSEPRNPTSNYAPPQKRGLLESSGASAILDVMFRQKGLGHSQNYRGERIAMVKQTMESIRQMFRQKH
ncbi:hypothetical protein GGR55DRAFT_673085 [Xylaria sp. FL0064]|nr:hypothetical protein GGR55DRAFT_673085 [Xylaria sp. FL0064]